MSNLLVSVFLPLIIVMRILSAGTFIHFENTDSNYDIGLTSAVILNSTSAVTTFTVTNYHQQTLAIGEGNVRAYNQDTGASLRKTPCLEGFTIRVPQNETKTGSICWSGTNLRSILVVYDHTIFVRDTGAWQFR